MAYTIERVINNNVLCVRDEKDRELIVTGKGIGFGSKAGQAVEAQKVEKTYRMQSSQWQHKLADLTEEIDYDVLIFTDEMVRHIRQSLPYPLSESLLITLADHINFAIVRCRSGANFTNPLMDSIKAFYPEEYRLGCIWLEKIRTRFAAPLIDDEAGFIALHIVNAELGTTMSTLNDITTLVDGCVQVVEYYYDTAYDRDSLAFSRFALHLRFFAQRVFQGKLTVDGNADEDQVFRELIARNCNEHYRCAQCIAEYVQKTWHKTLSDEELVFLTLHLKRINTNQ